MLTDTSSTPYLELEQTKKRRRQVPIYFSSSKALKRSKMTKGKTALSKTNESASGDVQRALHFGRGETGESEDVLALTVEYVFGHGDSRYFSCTKYTTIGAHSHCKRFSTPFFSILLLHGMCLT